MASLFYCFFLEAQLPQCCSATRQFAMLMTDANFLKAHQSPLPFRGNKPAGKMISFSTPDGKIGHAYLVEPVQSTDRYLVVFHEWWGLNDYIRHICDSLRTALGTIRVIAPDLFDGKVATNPKDAARYSGAVTDARAKAIIEGVLGYAGPRARVFTIGWCFGGGWSLQASLLAGTRAAGCVMYYGMPEKDITRLKTLHADVLGIFANRDQWINPGVVDQFVADMKKAGKHLEVHRYDADHGFANPSNPVHNEAATRSAYRYTLAFLKARLPKP